MEEKNRRTKTWFAFVGLVGTVFATGVAFVPTASAHTCPEDFWGAYVHNYHPCGACSAKDGPHDHYYMLLGFRVMDWGSCKSHSCSLDQTGAANMTTDNFATTLFCTASPDLVP